MSARVSRSRFDYDEAERYLRSLELFGMRFGLERMRRLMTALESPNDRFASVQVLGTNGKSSTTRMIASILRRHGMRVGTYLSPHLRSFAERVEADEQPLSPDSFAAAVERARQAAELVNRGLPAGDRVTQFEALTAAAYWELARREVDVAVVEAGLGGRFDATSVVHARVTVITNVGLEHSRWLGPSERHIAEEKLAVVPAGGALVAGPLGGEALAVAERVTTEREAELLLAGRDFSLEDGPGETFAVRTPGSRYERIALRPLGRFQRVNFAVATAAAERFFPGRSLDAEAVCRAAAELELPGRLEVVGELPLVLLDGAHNPEAARALRPSLEAVVGERRLVTVMSVLDDKDATGILSVLLPLCAGAVFTRSSHPRALSPATLESLCGQLGGPPSEVVATPVAAVERARRLAGPEGAVLVTGSIYLLSDLVRDAASHLPRARSA
jgi:dihydrofolate synthase/folylpolyglutamate synthase